MNTENLLNYCSWLGKYKHLKFPFNIVDLFGFAFICCPTATSRPICEVYF